MHPINLFLIFIVICSIVSFYLKGYYKGIVASLFFLILLPENILLKIGGQIPEFTIHRIILLFMLFFWFKENGISLRGIKVPFFKLLCLVASTSLLSAVLSVVFMPSLKSSISFITEQLIFYILFYTSLSSLTYSDRLYFLNRVIVSITSAITLVALLGIIERWTGFNFTDVLPRISAVGMQDITFHSYKGRVKSTFPHAILLGYALAMWCPVMLVLITYETKRIYKIIVAMSFFVIGSCLYFSTSRGAWVGSMLSVSILFALGTKKIKISIFIAGLVLFSTITLRPQIGNKIFGLMSDTFDANASTLKSRSYQYRYELWWRAYSEISKSPIRLFFGYGDNSRHYMDLSGIERISGRPSHFWSWDNEYACVLLERGVIGLFFFLLLYFSLFLKFLSKAIHEKKYHGGIIIAFFAAVASFAFMMTNVKVFSSQIFFLFWTIVSVGLVVESAKGSKDE